MLRNKLLLASALLITASCTYREDEIIPPRTSVPEAKPEITIDETQVVLTSPDNGYAGSVAPILQWTAMDGVSAYTVTASRDSICLKFTEGLTEECTNELWILGHPTNSFPMENYGAGTYYWRVAAYDNMTGHQTGWSKIQRFTIAAPKPLSPASNTSDTDVNLLLKWEAFAGAKSYNVILYSPENKTEVIKNITTTSYELSRLSLTSVYSWKVSANIDEGTTGWSDLWSFSTTGFIPYHSLVSWMPFNRGVYDECAYGQLGFGSLAGSSHGATPSFDRFGQGNSSYSFDGNDIVRITGTTRLYDIEGNLYSAEYTLPNGNAQRSVSLWFESKDNIQKSVLFKWGGDQPNESFGLALAGGLPQFLENGSNPKGSVLHNDGEWHNAVITFDGTNVAIYIDGVLNVSHVNANLNTSQSELVIGEQFTGSIDDVAIYNRPLTEEEIKFIASKKG